MSLPESVWQILMWNTHHQLLECMEQFHFTDLGSDGKKSKSGILMEKGFRNVLPLTAHSITSQLTVFDEKHFHFSKNVESSQQFNFFHPSCPPAFLLCFKYCIDKELCCHHGASQHSYQFAENILISPHCYLCESASSSAHNYSKVEPEGLVPELIKQTQEDLKGLFKLADLFRTNKRISRNSWNNAVLLTTVTRTHTATAAKQLNIKRLIKK